MMVVRVMAAGIVVLIVAAAAGAQPTALAPDGGAAQAELQRDASSADAILAAQRWMAHIDGSEARPLPEAPDDLAAILPLMVGDHDVAAAMLEHLPPDLSYAIGQIRVQQSAGVGLDAQAMQILDWLPGLQAAAAGLPPFPFEEQESLCPDEPHMTPVPDLPTYGGDGGYGSVGICILGTDSGTYRTAPAGFGALGGLMIDLGGDDAYSVPTGRSFGAFGGIFIDLGGNDRYDVDDDGDLDGALGLGTAGIFVDGDGDDQYGGINHNGNLGSHGGRFIEAAGDDEYTLGYAGSPPGSGQMGILGGMFIEMSGNDRYKWSNSARAGTGMSGGAVLEMGGDDRYSAESATYMFGVVEGAFVDLWGDDVYEVGSHSLGVSGTFVDFGGQDRYQADHQSIAVTGAAPATGPHGGLFLDTEGGDEYDLIGPPAVTQTPLKQAAVELAGVFIDTDDPMDTWPNGQIISGDIDEISPMHVATPYEAFQDDAFHATHTGGPQVVPLGATPTLTFAVEADMPVHVSGRDSSGTPITFGDHADALVIDGSADLSGMYEATTPGTHDLQILFEDPLGVYVFQRVQAGAITVDTVAPSISLAFSDGANGNLAQWHSEADPLHGVTVRAEDADSGIQAIYMATGAPATTASQQVFSATVQTSGRAHMGTTSHLVGLDEIPEGATTYHFLAIDGVGNEARRSLTIQIDRSAPDVAWHVNGTMGNDGWFLDAPLVRLEAQDALAGVADMTYRWSGNATGSGGSGSSPWNVTPTWQDGVSRVEADVDDGAHEANTASTSLLVRLDRQAPVVSITRDGALAPIKGELDVAPDASGIRSTEIRVWRNGTTPPAFADGEAFQIRTPGSWDIAYRVEDVAGNVARGLQTIEVPNQPPMVSIDPIRPTPTGQTIRFNATSDDADGTIQEVVWMIDGQTFRGDSVRYAFQDDGEYRVEVTATDDLGATSTAAVDVTVFNQAPVLSITGPQTADRITDATFTAVISDPDGTPGDIEWDFGDGTAVGASVQHRFGILGTITVTASVTDDDGARSDVTWPVQVVNLPPELDIVAPEQVIVGEPATFTADVMDPDGAVPHVVWSFPTGDLEGRQVDHAFQAPGEHTVTATATDADGAVVQRTAEVEVVDRIPPKAVIGDVVSNGWDTPVLFADASVAGDLPIAERTWWFGDGATSTERHPSHVYDGRGTYVVRLTVADAEGRSSTATRLVDVAGAPPTVAVHGSSPVLSGTDPGLSIEVQDPDGGPVETTWELLDGDSVVASNDHGGFSFDAPGEHVVRVTAEDDDGMTATDSIVIVVENRPPTATLDPVEPVLAGEPVTFSYHAVDAEGPVDIVLDHGDGTHGPTHIYTQPGTYTAVLTVTDAHGATAHATTPVEVLNRPPTAAIRSTAGTLLTGQEVTFTDASHDPDGEDLTAHWDLGDGTTSAGAQLTHAFEDPGTYVVNLTVRDGQGAAAWTTYPVTVHNRHPHVTVEGPTEVAAGEPIVLRSQAHDTDGTIAAVRWQDGDRTHSGASWSLTPSKGLHAILVTAIDDRGASTTVLHQLTVTDRDAEPITSGPDPDILDDDDVQQGTEGPEAGNGTRQGSDKEAPGPGFLAALTAACLWLRRRTDA